MIIHAVLARQETITASTRDDFALPRKMHIQNIEIFMSSFAVTDAATYAELDGMIGDIEVETSVGVESAMDATEYTTLYNYLRNGGQLVDATVADNDRQVFLWYHPFGMGYPHMAESPMYGLDGKHARTIYLNHAADGAVDNRVFSIYANGRGKSDINPKYYGMFVGRRNITGAVGGRTAVEMPENTRGGVHALLARMILFGTTQLPDAENASHILNTIRQINLRIDQTEKIEIDPDVAQAIGNIATDAGVDSVQLDNGSFIVDLAKRLGENWNRAKESVIGEEYDAVILEGAANAYRVVYQAMLPQLP